MTSICVAKLHKSGEGRQGEGVSNTREGRNPEGGQGDKRRAGRGRGRKGKHYKAAKIVMLVLSCPVMLCYADKLLLHTEDEWHIF